MVLPCPPIHLVADSTTMSAPCAMGLQIAPPAVERDEWCVCVCVRGGQEEGGGWDARRHEAVCVCVGWLMASDQLTPKGVVDNQGDAVLGGQRLELLKARNVVLLCFVSCRVVSCGLGWVGAVRHAYRATTDDGVASGPGHGRQRAGGGKGKGNDGRPTPWYLHAPMGFPSFRSRGPWSGRPPALRRRPGRRPGRTAPPRPGGAASA